jgi:hypothetical protein
VQESFREGNTHNGQKNTTDKGRGQCGVNGVVYNGVFLAAQSVGNGDTGTYGKSDEEVDQQIGNGTGGTHGCHADTSAEPSYNDQIGCIKEQLQKAGKNDGNGISNDVGQQRACQHAAVCLVQDSTFFSDDYRFIIERI